MSIDIDPWWEEWWWSFSGDNPHNWQQWLTLAVGTGIGLAIGIAI